jgi:hypothetical protein
MPMASALPRRGLSPTRASICIPRSRRRCASPGSASRPFD